MDAAEIAAQCHESAALPGADRGLEYALRAATEATAYTAHERAVTFLRIAADLASSREAAVRADVWRRLALAEGDALQNPRGLAEGLAAFFARHPIET